MVMHTAPRLATTYRPDIDGLRAVAVLSVVAYHAMPDLFTGGFVGVDVFFVISGFLITSILIENLQRGSFSVAAFYARRIRRLLPALLLVLLACLVFGWFVLFADEYKPLGAHVAAGAGFVSNLLLWREAGYFDVSADTKPLLHLWSLGVEEQFYLLWPVALWGAWKARINLLTVTALIALVSFALNLTGIQNDAVGTFFSPATRLWELLAGSLLAGLACHPRPRLANLLAVLGSLLLTVACWRIDRQLSYPGAWALLPVAGAVLILFAGPTAWINRKVLSARVLVWFGLISFPLYLWHWPLLAFLRVIAGELPALTWRLAAVGVSVVLAWLTYRFVERPIRQRRTEARVVGGLLLSAAVLGGAGYAVYAQDGLNARRVNDRAGDIVQLGDDDPVAHKACLERYGLQAETIRYCRLTGNTKPRIAIIGDSHGAALFYPLSRLLDQRLGEGLLMLGGRLFVNVAAYPEGNAFEMAVYKGGITATRFVAQEPSIDTVILVSRGPRYMSPERYTTEKTHFYLLDDPSIVSKVKVFEIGLRRTLDLVVAQKRHVIMVLENPTLDFDPSACRQSRPIGFSDKSACAISVAAFQEEHGEYRDVVRSVLRDYPQVAVFDPASHLCDDTICRGKINGQILYGDRNHMSEAGAAYLSKFLLPLIEKQRGTQSLP